MTDVTDQTPPLLQGPSEKERKYDRQLRLWAASGQEALEASNILLVNSHGTVGTETLKNLILPGIGRFTIVDEGVVAHSDLGANFFLDASSLGKSRAKCCTQFLCELNPDVTGEWLPQDNEPLDLSTLVANASPAFTAVIYTLPQKQSDVEAIRAQCTKHEIPLVAIHSVGFYSYFQISLPRAFPIVDTHPDENSTADLRLLSPWSELSQFAERMTQSIDDLDDHTHGHIPMVVILLHFLEKWQRAHDEKHPTSYSEKKAFRDEVADASRTNNPEGGEENFEEAVAAVMKHVVSSPIPASLQEVFDSEHLNQDVDKGRPSFWIIAQAVKEFYFKHGCLPVSGGLPDMKAQSDVYVKLQNIYKEKARLDAREVLAQIQSKPGGRDVKPAEVELFCKNARFVKIINGNQAGSAHLQPKDIAEREFNNDKMAALAGPEMPLSLLPIYMSLLATSQHALASADEIVARIQQHWQWPGATDSEETSDMDWKLEADERLLQAAREVSRAAGGELHNVSALTGGMVAQELIKIITKQYIPIDNTCIYDGIGSRCQVLRL